MTRQEGVKTGARMVLALAIVGVTTLVARAFDADLTTAALLLLLAALVATLLGRAAAVAGDRAAGGRATRGQRRATDLRTPPRRFVRI
jgi:hypothetical protein